MTRTKDVPVSGPERQGMERKFRIVGRELGWSTDERTLEVTSEIRREPIGFAGVNSWGALWRERRT
jgi:hypothetical protein